MIRTILALWALALAIGCTTSSAHAVAPADTWLRESFAAGPSAPTISRRAVAGRSATRGSRSARRASAGRRTAAPSRRQAALPSLTGGPGITGIASWYKMGTRTANGERYNPDGISAAHRTLPFGTRVRVTNLNNGRSIVVRINDRGPFIGGRVIDLSRGAARAVGMGGLARVKLAVLGR